MAIIEQISAWIASEVRKLTDDQKRGFTEWLASHLRIDLIDTDNDLTDCLKNWFESLPVDRLIFELSLFMNEISWWQEKSSNEISLMSVKWKIERRSFDDPHQFLE